MTSPTHTTLIETDVCIVGNGAIAKATALGLAQAGHRVTLLLPPAAPARAEEGANEPSWDVRVYALNHTAYNLLSQLRVWGAMDASRIQAVDAMVVNGDKTSSASKAAKTDVAATGDLTFDAYGARVGALAWIVEDRNLNQALDSALKFAPVQQVTGRATRLATEASHATLHLDDGTAIEADLVIGADGAHSWVRGQCDINYDYRSYNQRGVVANFSCEKPHHGAAHQWFTCDEGIIALLPLPGNRVSLVWSAPNALADTLMEETLSELAVRLALYSEQELGALRPLTPEAVKAFPLALLRPHAITAPRVALVGDAAHVVHPLAGHGMNLGFGDVTQLLKTIAAREERRDVGDPRVLERYARARKEEVLLMQLATDGLERLFSANLEPLRVVRNFGLHLVNKLPMVKRKLIQHALGK